MESEDDMSYMIGVMSKIDDILTTVGKGVQNDICFNLFKTQFNCIKHQFRKEIFLIIRFCLSLKNPFEP